MRLDWRKSSLKLLSLVLAFVLWAYVSNEQNPVREKVLNVNLEQSGLPANGIVSGLPESVKLRIEGNKNQLANLSPVDFRAQVQIPEGKYGEVSLPVKVTAPTGLRVAGVSPEEVKVTLDRVVERYITVAVNVRGTPAAGFLALAPQYQPASVLVRGPGRVVNSLDHATAQVDIQGASANVEQNVPVSVGPVNVTLIPPEVKIMVPVVSSVSAVTIPVRPQVSGSPASGYVVKGSTAEPAGVQVIGSPEALKGISSVSTEAVDIQGLDKSLAREVSVLMPAGVTSIQPGKVKVTVEIAKAESGPSPPATGTPNEPPPAKQ